jgi:hypothetical protein
VGWLVKANVSEKCALFLFRAEVISWDSVYNKDFIAYKKKRIKN